MEDRQSLGRLHRIHASRPLAGEAARFLALKRVGVDVEFVPAVEPGVEFGGFGGGLGVVFGEVPGGEAFEAVLGAGGADVEVGFGAVEGVAGEAELGGGGPDVCGGAGAGGEEATQEVAGSDAGDAWAAASSRGAR